MPTVADGLDSKSRRNGGNGGGGDDWIDPAHRPHPPIRAASFRLCLIRFDLVAVSGGLSIDFHQFLASLLLLFVSRVRKNSAKIQAPPVLPTTDVWPALGVNVLGQLD